MSTQFVVILILAVIIAIALFYQMWQRGAWHIDSFALSRVFFWFGLACGVMGVFTQYGFTYQVGTQNVFGDPSFFFLLGSLSMLAGIFVNTDRANRIL